MSTVAEGALAASDNKPQPSHYKGFVAGVFSGVAKLSVGHPFDTIKVRLQTSEKSHFRGPLDCVLQTIRNEGFRGLYKGATPPLVGWMFMDSLMLGSLTAYRRILRERVFAPRSLDMSAADKLPAYGHGIAGTFAGWTVSLIAAPVEHVKARLQVQYAADKAKRLYKGPIDCTKRIFKAHGVRGLYHGLFATMLFRTFFFFWWSTYDVFSHYFHNHTSLSTPAVNFWAGGLSAQVFWLTSYPSDVVKQRIMTDPLDPDKRKFRHWRDAAQAVWRENGWRGYWRGFVPCFLRAFPANAVALVAFEGVMRSL
ncbi:mitochondrial carrier [Trichodelitschia bisporula]|uniref:Mitochondrial carrier n=1 Tax=Trichodelitschia bisporula TaxID=703511 RepID=A0A6G1HNT7_9PEZI|nr:mitochondrial carrier [Trichodelitschia bisporula]